MDGLLIKTVLQWVSSSPAQKHHTSFCYQ